jgi:hypothetical protein
MYCSYDNNTLSCYTNIAERCTLCTYITLVTTYMNVKIIIQELGKQQSSELYVEMQLLKVLKVQDKPATITSTQ